jgi:hypothetical protein
MKKTFFYIILLCLSANVNAQTETQTESKPKPTWQFGLNTTQLLKQFLNPNSSSTEPYTLVGRRIQGNKAFRFGFGIFWDSRKEQVEKFLDSKTFNNQSLSMRLGYEWRRELHPRWNAYYGIDVVGIYKNDENVSDSGFDKVTIQNQNIDTGLAGVLGMEYKLNERVSLSTEGSLGMFYSTGKDGTKFSAATQTDSFKSKSGFKTITQLPISLFLNVKF